MQIEIFIGDRVYFNCPGSPSDGRPGTVKDKKTWPCGTMHYCVIWDNGGEVWVEKSLLKK